MAIQDFGQGLLNRQRTQIKRRDKDVRKAQTAQVLGTVVGTVGNAYMQAKADAFLQSEPIMAEKIAFRNAAAAGEGFINRQKAIDAAGGNEREFFFEQGYDSFARQAEIELRKRGDRRLIGDAGAYKSVLEKEVYALVDKQVEAHRNGYEQALKLGDQDSFDSMIALKSRNARPTNIVEGAISGVRNWLGGKSQEDITQEAIQAIEQSPLMQNVDRLESFRTAFKDSNNVASAYDFSKLEVPDVGDDKLWGTVAVKDTVEGAGGAILYKTTTDRVQLNTGDTKQLVSNVSIDFAAATDPVKFAADLLKAQMTAFNFAIDGKNQLSSEAYSLFTQEMKNQDINLTNITTTAEYKKVADAYSEFITATAEGSEEVGRLGESRLKNPELRAETLAIFDVFSGSWDIEAELATIKGMTADLTPGSDEYNAKVREQTAARLEISTRVAEVYKIAWEMGIDLREQMKGIGIDFESLQ